MIDLARIPLLSGATSDQAQQIAREASVVEGARGTTLFPDYTVTDAFWILIEGHWRVTRRVAGTPHVMFENDRPGSWTGGIPIIDAIAPPRAELLSDARMLRIPSTVLENLARANDRVAKRLLEAVHWGAGHIGGLIPDDR